MICVYDIGNEEYEKNGDAVLMPTSGSVRQIAAGNYTLDLVHPIDQYGKWEHLVPEAVIRAPIPQETIENAYSGLEADLYVTTEKAALREGPSEPQTITYSTWSISAYYSVGSKVTWNNKNYQCNFYDETSPYAHIAPPSCPWWTEIARTTPGSPLLINLKANSKLYLVDDYDTNWYEMTTLYGLQGYIKKSQVQFVRHLTPDETGPREIDTQLFRIKTVVVDTKRMEVSVSAEHVSYDLNGILIDRVKIERQAPVYALAWIENAFMMDYEGMIATNMKDTGDVTYTGEISGKSGMYALIDPDKGVVPCFGAEFRRDNWDLFVMNRTNTDRGFRIRYRANMRGVQWKTDSTKLKTRIVPVAKAEDGSNFYLYPTRWIDSSHINDYETVYMDRIKVNGQVGKDDGSETDTTWTISTLRAEMARQAQNRFDVDQCDRGVDEITIDFVMLGNTAEYPWLKALQSILLYDTVIATNERTGISASMTVSEIEFDIVKKRITAAKVANVKAYNVKNVSGFNVLNNSITGDKLTDEAGGELMSQAVDEAAEYTDQKAGQTLYSAKSYADEQAAEAVETAASNTSSAISTYDTQIKRYIQQHYQPL